MNEKQVLNDLKAIRQIMDRTRQSTSGESGWFSVTGGMMWLVGFLGQQFLPEHLTGWVWLVGNTIGLLIIVWLWVRLTRTGQTSSPVMRSIMLSWLALGVFVALFIWIFEVRTIIEILLLVLVTTAFGVIQVGLLFSYWPFSLAGLGITAAIVSAYLLTPDYFFLTAALLGGGLLIGIGLWMVRSGAQVKGAR
ncbi:MAG: hypothetical protein JW918_12740 [Anaerolineae bacterium]|nr:hypothetical protein [Anaerolineae bacterium]